MRITLASLAPDSFVLGPERVVEQFTPQKLFGTGRPQVLLSDASSRESRLAKPWAVEIHPSSRCQLRCRYCSYGQRNQDRRELPAPVMGHLLSQLDELAIGSLIFSGGGDPLAWSRGRLKNHLHTTRSYRCSIATNGLGLETHLDKAALANIDIVQIHVPGFDQHTFARTTGARLFSSFTSNLAWLLANRDRNVTQVSGKVLVDRRNYRTAEKYVEFCANIGFDVVILKLAGNFETGQDVELSETQKIELKQILATCAAADRYPARIDAIATQDSTVELPLPTKCWTIELGLYALIRSNGDVFPCVASPYDVQNRIGNVCERDLLEIWNGRTHQNTKAKLNEDMLAGRCKLNVCRHLRYNYVIEELLADGGLPNGPQPVVEAPKLL